MANRYGAKRWRWHGNHPTNSYCELDPAPSNMWADTITWLDALVVSRWHRRPDYAFTGLPGADMHPRPWRGATVQVPWCAPPHHHHEAENITTPQTPLSLHWSTTRSPRPSGRSMSATPTASGSATQRQQMAAPCGNATAARVTSGGRPVSATVHNAAFAWYAQPHIVPSTAAPHPSVLSGAF